MIFVTAAMAASRRILLFPGSGALYLADPASDDDGGVARGSRKGRCPEDPFHGDAPRVVPDAGIYQSVRYLERVSVLSGRQVPPSGCCFKFLFPQIGDVSLSRSEYLAGADPYRALE